MYKYTNYYIYMITLSLLSSSKIRFTNFSNSFRFGKYESFNKLIDGMWLISGWSLFGY